MSFLHSPIFENCSENISRKDLLPVKSRGRETTSKQGCIEIRHTCEQSDALASYSYTEHDGRYYAVQDLVDGKNNVKITTSWLKSEDGADWSVRVEGDAIDPCELRTA